MKPKQLKKLLEKNNFFDKIFYLRQYHDARLADAIPIDHYITVGIKENRMPNPNFEPDWYLSNYPDVKEANVNPVEHFIIHGLGEGRLQNAEEKKHYDEILKNGDFDPVFYKNNYEDLKELDEKFDLVTHYVRYGQYEGRVFINPNVPDDLSEVDLEIILQNTEAISNQGIINNDGTNFDLNYYLENNPDVAEADVEPEWHYYACGEKEGRKPNAIFDPAFYYSLNSDVRVAKISAFSHYRENGIYEQRLGCSPKDTSKKKSKELAPLLFVGHDGIQAGSEIVLLEVIRWFYENTNRRIKVLLLAPGPVANQYAYYADVYVLPEGLVDDSITLQNFIGEKFQFIYLNTVVTGRLFNLLDDYQLSLDGDIVTHIHEMERVIAEHEVEMQNQLKNSQLWISASPASSITLRDKYKIKPEKIVTVPAFINPVANKAAIVNELQSESRKALGLSQKSTVISGCGTVYWRKGADLFLEAARLIKENTNQFVEFVWVGDGPDKIELENQLTDSEKKYIKFVGNRTDSNKVLAAADIFFLSSREDPFPLVVLESAQHYIPTVCFGPATGITAFIEDDAGVVVPEISASIAANAILELISNEDKRMRLGKVAKSKLFSNYTTEQQNIKIFEAIKEHTSYKPSVSVIVPFYNHVKFIEERLDSILNQSIKDIEIIALDDFSTDGTAEKVKPYLSDCRIKLVQNEVNSGSPFKQWEKGIRLATAPIVWIAEGDDSCSSNFLETLLPYFDDHMVNVAAAKTEIINEHGELQKDALKPYLDMAFPDKFNSNYIKDGFVEVNEQFGAMCTLVNASGLLIRKSSFGQTLQTAQDFKMCGDWLIYLECLKDGKIAFDVTTSNFFRRHSASQVHKVEGSEIYFNERYAITEYVVKHFTVNRRMLNKAFKAIDHEWQRFKYKHPDGTQLHQLYNKELLKVNTSYLEKHPHVGFYVHGMTFSKGGIERLATQLANHLVEKGWRVTIFCRVHSDFEPVYPLFESVNVIPIFDEHIVEESVKRLNSALCHSDIDVFVPMLSEWLFEPIVEAAQNTGMPIIASEHNDPWKIEELWWNHEKRVACFKKVEAVHLLLHEFTESLPQNLHKKIITIPNGVKIPRDVNYDNRDKLIVTAGRLEPQKRFDRLIDAAALIQNELRQQGYRIEIYGEGSLENDLKQQINSLNLQDVVYLKGKTSHLDSIFEKADIFVIPSEFEGFGMVLVEALAHGLPSIGFAGCNGPNEIIRDRKEGVLVKDVQSLSEAILDFLSTTERPRHLATERAKDYSLDKFFDQWEETLFSVASDV